MLRVRVFTLPGTALSAEASRASLELSALGDFEPSNESAEVLPADRAGAALRFPAETQAVQARLAAGYAGYAERRGDAALDVLLWPERATARLARADYPGPGGGQALGFATSSGTLLVAGGDDARDSESLVGTLRFSASTGAATRGGVGGGGLSQPRAFATATPFGDGFVVAGGQEPVDGVPESELELYATAELVGEPGEPVPLQYTRTHHAALALADGRTLLVGGRTKVGSVSIAQYQLEIVDPEARRASIGDSIAPRIDPVAVPLSDGRIFVGGGTLLGGSLSAPVGEWLTAEARRDSTRLSAEVPPRFDRSFVATPGGGVLAVGGCEDRPASSDADAAACRVCRAGCPPLEGWDAWWVDADGAATPVSLEGISAPRPVLFPGTDGSPWLVAAEPGSPEIPRLFRFDPWGARFEPAEVPSELRLPRAGFPALSLAPDTFVWVDDDELLGLRLGARSRFTRDVALVLSSAPDDPQRPAHLVPTRALDERTAYDGALTLADPNLAVLVADTDYADVTVKLSVRGDALPRVQLGPTALGGDDCPWPDGEARGGDADLPTVVRRGGRAQLRFHGARSATCAVGDGRLTVALVAGERASVVEQLEIARGSTAF